MKKNVFFAAMIQEQTSYPRDISLLFLYGCEYCGTYILDSRGFDILKKDENKFKMACVLNERRLKGFGGIALDDETKKEDLVCGYPRISVNELLAQFPQTASESSAPGFPWTHI